MLHDAFDLAHATLKSSARLSRNIRTAGARVGHPRRRLVDLQTVRHGPFHTDSAILPDNHRARQLEELNDFLDPEFGARVSTDISDPISANAHSVPVVLAQCAAFDVLAITLCLVHATVGISIFQTPSPHCIISTLFESL
jgi:hypothetical protein